MSTLSKTLGVVQTWSPRSSSYVILDIDLGDSNHAVVFEGQRVNGGEFESVTLRNKNRRDCVVANKGRSGIYKGSITEFYSFRLRVSKASTKNGTYTVEWSGESTSVPSRKMPEREMLKQTEYVNPANPKTNPVGFYGFETAVSLGLVPNHSLSLWHGKGSVYTRGKADILEKFCEYKDFPREATTFSISSTSFLDRPGEPGFHTIYLSGLDNNWNIVSEDIDLNGTTPVETTRTYLRLNSMYGKKSGTVAGGARGEIKAIHNGKGVTMGTIKPNETCSFIPSFSVPREYMALIVAHRTTFVSSEPEDVLSVRRVHTYDVNYSSYNETPTAIEIMRINAGSNENVHENLVYYPHVQEGDDLLIYMTRYSNVPFVQTEFRLVMVTD